MVENAFFPESAPDRCWWGQPTQSDQILVPIILQGDRGGKGQYEFLGLTRRFSPIARASAERHRVRRLCGGQLGGSKWQRKECRRRKSNTEKKTRVRWPFPRATLEEALKIAYAIKEHNGGNPWESDEVRKAIGAGTGGNAYFYLTAASRDYGLTTGTSTAEKIALADLGRDLVYAPNQEAEKALKLRAFLNVDIFKRVLEYYKGSNLPEMKYLGNTLQKEFDLEPETHEEFSRTFRENCQYLGITSGIPGAPGDESVPTGTIRAPETITLAEAAGASKLTAFVIMPFVERDPKDSIGFFAEVLRSLITPAAKDSQFHREDRKQAGQRSDSIHDNQ